MKPSSGVALKVLASVPPAQVSKASDALGLAAGLLPPGSICLICSAENWQEAQQVVSFLENCIREKLFDRFPAAGSVQ